MTALGRLEKVELRKVWTSESGDFTPWLASEENINILADTIDLELEIEAQEKGVGPFRADILCRDTATGSWVLIENQLERTDHVHLGQLITYAAGLSAVTIVWIAERFTEEHRAAIDWLNEITGDEFSFFGLEVELWRIGDSQIAPKFNVVSKPNDWTKQVSGAKQKFVEGELTETKRLQLEYWTAFRQKMEQAKSVIRPTKPHPQHWQDFSIGRSGIYVETIANIQAKRIAVQLILAGPNAKPHFYLLRRNQSAFDSTFGAALEWHEMLEKKQSRIRIVWEGCDPSDRSAWPQQHAWLLDKMQRFHQTFAQAAKNVDADDYRPEAEAE